MGTRNTMILLIMQLINVLLRNLGPHFNLSQLGELKSHWKRLKLSCVSNSPSPHLCHEIYKIDTKV